ncbi:VOC family protein [Chitinophaga rhizosphaerae]|uniref:VOC family protein n=1 Tax=Chitinophaga rhizosphaerae TaxID=1864947 RepID=UPI00196A2553|nr:VOC family protein [Chitinophaga rhizosphaerae]
MKPRISVLTICVADLDRAYRFYLEGMGLASEGIIGQEFEYGAVAFFDLQSGVKLAVWPRKSLVHDTGLEERAPSSMEFTIGHNVTTKTEVDAVLQQAEAAGARIIKPAHDTFWGGYAGYFSDPDGHLWEVVYNPGFMPEE